MVNEPKSQCVWICSRIDFIDNCLFVYLSQTKDVCSFCRLILICFEILSLITTENNILNGREGISSVYVFVKEKKKKNVLLDLFTATLCIETRSDWRDV